MTLITHLQKGFNLLNNRIVKHVDCFLVMVFGACRNSIEMQGKSGQVSWFTSENKSFVGRQQDFYRADWLCLQDTMNWNHFWRSICFFLSYLTTIVGRWYFNRAFGLQRLTNQSLYNKILLLQKFNDTLDFKQ